MPFSLVKVSISVSCLAFIVILDKNNDITALYKTNSSQVIYTDFYIIIFAISVLLLIRQNLQHPYLSYFIPCHRLPLRSLHWPSRDQKGILNIHPIICLRRIPGPARLVGLSLFFLLLAFCYSTAFTLSVLRYFLSIVCRSFPYSASLIFSHVPNLCYGAKGKVTPLAGPGLFRPWQWHLKVELSGLGVSEFCGKVISWVVFL